MSDTKNTSSDSDEDYLIPMAITPMELTVIRKALQEYCDAPHKAGLFFAMNYGAEKLTKNGVDGVPPSMAEVEQIKRDSMKFIDAADKECEKRTKETLGLIVKLMMQVSVEVMQRSEEEAKKEQPSSHSRS